MSSLEKKKDEGERDASQRRQKAMIADHFAKLSRAKEEGKKVVYTFVPGNLTELLSAFEVLPVLPEINALQSGMRGRSASYIAEAEKSGHSEDVCTYVKCDLGMLKSGNVGPTGQKLPPPDLLLLSYTGCFTLHEVVRAAAAGIQVSDRDAPGALPGRGRDHADDAQVRRRSDRT
jgi:benzoyl-CoA reductase subunit B